MTAELAAQLNNLSIVLRHLGQYERAAALLQESLDYKRVKGDRQGIAASLANLGNLALLRQEYAGAEASFRESVALRQMLGDQRGMLSPLSGLAALAMQYGEPVRSVRLYGACNALRREFGFPIAPEARERYDQNVAALRKQLGQADFEAARAMGESMTVDQAVAYALRPFSTGEPQTNTD